jgi:small subunit ribosomal protein S16
LVKIRLRRVGATKRPMYRIVAADSHAPRDGRFLENLGYYHPLTEPATIVVKRDRVDHWISHGAQPTEVVDRILKQAAEAPAIDAEPAQPTARRTRAAAAPSASAEAPVAEASVAESPPAERAVEPAEAPTQEPAENA